MNREGLLLDSHTFMTSATVLAVFVSHILSHYERMQIIKLLFIQLNSLFIRTNTLFIYFIFLKIKVLN